VNIFDNDFYNFLKSLKPWPIFFFLYTFRKKVSAKKRRNFGNSVIPFVKFDFSRNVKKCFRPSPTCDLRSSNQWTLCTFASSTTNLELATTPFNIFYCTLNRHLNTVQIRTGITCRIMGRVIISTGIQSYSFYSAPAELL
jgi:hypothetical protein